MRGREVKNRKAKNMCMGEMIKIAIASQSCQSSVYVSTFVHTHDTTQSIANLYGYKKRSLSRSTKRQTILSIK